MSKLHQARELVSTSLVTTRRLAKLVLPSGAIGVLLLALATLLLPGSLLAQTGRTTISGRVVDPTGAVVAGAKVVVTNVDTNFAVALDTNEKGYYEASQLVPGPYKITAEAAGFGKLVRQGITLVAGTPISIELKLAVSQTQETMVVTADAPLINAEAATGGQVLGADVIANTPVSGANASLLLKFAQGVTASEASNRYMAGNLNANGNISNIGTAGQNGKNQFYLDGAPNESNAHTVAYSPSTDEIAEIKSETSGFDASMGKTLGVSVVATSKSGTNDFHGGVREMYYARRWQSFSHFGATNYANQYAKTCALDASSAACAATKRSYGKPGLIEHNSGVNVGGPVIVPKVFNGKDKLFFFLNISRDDYGDSAIKQITVPTAQQRLGDFSDLARDNKDPNAPWGVYQIYNPLSVVNQGGTYVRQPVPGNNLNNVPALAALMAKNPLIAFANKYYPQPNTASTGGSYAIKNNYTYTEISPQLFTAYLLRLDFTPNQKERFYARLSKTNYNQDRVGPLLEDLDHRLLHDQGRILNGGWTHMFSSSSILDTSIGYTQWSRVTTWPNLEKLTPSAWGLPGYVDAMAGQYNDPYLTLVNVGDYYQIGQNSTPRDLQRILSARSSLSYIKGSHTFNVGGDVRQQMRSAQPSGNTSGLITFGNTFTKRDSAGTTVTDNLGTQYASFLLGIPNSASYDTPAKYVAHDPYFGLYVQDSWRATPKLTLSMGLRFEYEYGPVDKSNREVTYWDPNATLPIAGAAQASWSALSSAFQSAFATAKLPAPASSINVLGGSMFAGVNGASAKRFDNNWRLMPRFGFAYNLNSTMVVRGGYGLFYDSTNVLNQSINQNGFSRNTPYNTSTDQGVTWLMGNPSAGVSPMSDPFYAQASGARYLSPVGSSLGSAMYLGQSFTFYPKDYKPARQQRWQVEFQKQLGNRDAVTIGYTGSWTDQLEWSQNLNALPASIFTGGAVQNPNTTILNKQDLANPFLLANFAALQTSHPELYNTMALQNAFKSAKVSYASMLKPYPWMGDINERTNKGASKFHSVNLQYNRRLSKGLQAVVNYQKSFQRDKDFTWNSFDVNPSWRLSNNSRPSRLTLTGRMELPLGRGQRWLSSGILAKIFGGQTLDFSYEAQQGQLIDFGNLIYTGNPYKLKDSIKLSHPEYINEAGYVQWLNRAVFNTESGKQLSAYNLRQFPNRIEGVRQQGLNNVSVNYQKTVDLSERVKFTGRFEAIDVFNHRVVGSMSSTDPTKADFGKVTANGIDYARWIQIQGKITF